MGSTAEMPFLDHLEELRWRIIWSLAAIVVCVAIGFVLVIKFNLLEWLQSPILPYLKPGHRLMNTHPGGGFSIMMSTALIIGVVLALPVVLYQAWLFLAPALHRHEKRVVLPVIIGAVFLFICGAALAWFFVLPMTLRFLTSMGDEAFDQMISATEYFGFATSLVLAMGAVFELPILILALSALGLVNPKLLKRFRRHAFIGAFALGAIISPGDAITASVAMTLPIYLLYELSIGLSAIVFRRRERAEAEAMQDDGVPA